METMKTKGTATTRFLGAIDLTIEGLVSQPLKGRLRRFRSRDLKISARGAWMISRTT